MVRSLRMTIDTTSSTNTMPMASATMLLGFSTSTGASDAPANQPTVVPAADAPRPHPNTRTYDRSVRFATLASRHHTMRMNRLYAMLTSSPWMTPRPPNNGTTRLPKHVRMMMG